MKIERQTVSFLCYLFAFFQKIIKAREQRKIATQFLLLNNIEFSSIECKKELEKK